LFKFARPLLSGATAWLAQGLAQITQGMQPIWILAVLMGLMGLLTNFVSNNAAAAIGTPLAFSLASTLNLPTEPFVMSVLFGCNLCYLTPMGYQTNLLVMSAGGYKFSDFVKVGTPLFIIMWVSLTWALAWRYGF
jgi:di/tricarboxylate transporter